MYVMKVYYDTAMEKIIGIYEAVNAQEID